MAIVDFAQGYMTAFRLQDTTTLVRYVNFVEGLNSIKLIYNPDAEDFWNNPYNMPVIDIDFMAITGSLGSNPTTAFPVYSITQSQYNARVDQAWNSLDSDRIFVVRSSEYATLGYNTTYGGLDIESNATHDDLLWRDDPNSTLETDYPTYWGNSFARLWQPGQYVQFFFTLTASDVDLMNRGDITTMDPGTFGANLILRCRSTGDTITNDLMLNINNKGTLIMGTGGTWTTLDDDEGYYNFQGTINTNSPQRSNIVPSFTWSDYGNTQTQLTDTSTVNADGEGPILAWYWEWQDEDNYGNPIGTLQTSTSQNPLITVTSYATVYLTLYNKWGHTIPISHQIHRPLRAAFDWLPVSPDAGEEVAFDASDTPGAVPEGVTDGIDSVESYTWFVDGVQVAYETYQDLGVPPWYVPASPYMSYTFTADGSYLVTLTVLWYNGEEDSITHVVRVGGFIQPDPNPDPQPPFGTADFSYTQRASTVILPRNPGSRLPVTLPQIVTANTSGTLSDPNVLANTNLHVLCYNPYTDPALHIVTVAHHTIEAEAGGFDIVAGIVLEDTPVVEFGSSAGETFTASSTYSSALIDIRIPISSYLTSRLCMLWIWPVFAANTDAVSFARPSVKLTSASRLGVTSSSITVTTLARNDVWV